MPALADFRDLLVTQHRDKQVDWGMPSEAAVMLNAPVPLSAAGDPVDFRML
jgi:hypothetical protein